MSNNSMPKWFTPERKAYLVDLFFQSGGFCVYGHKPCLNPAHHYQNYIEGIIHNWVADDKERDTAEWQQERLDLHRTSDRQEPLRGQFSGLSRDIFHSNQPQHYIEGIGISGLLLKPFAKVRLSSSFMRLHINLGDTLRQVSKNRKRKAIRYGKPLPLHIEEKINRLVKEAVSDYMNH